jgi:hypothetical protein
MNATPNLLGILESLWVLNDQYILPQSCPFCPSADSQKLSFLTDPIDPDWRTERHDQDTIDILLEKHILFT